MASSNKLQQAKLWIEKNHQKFLPKSEIIEQVIILKADIRRDPDAANLGLNFGNRFEIRPHLLFVIRGNDNSRKIGIAEISESSLGLTTLGIMQAYSRMAEPDYSIILCEKSLSRELLDLKSNPNVSTRIFRYAKNKEIIAIDVEL